MNEFERKKLQRGVKKLSKIIRSNPRDFRSYTNRAEYYRLLGKYKKVEADYASSVKINPIFPGTYFNRGVYYSTVGKVDLAMKDYTTALALCRKSGNRDKELLNNILNNRGSAYRQLGKYDLALKDLKEAVKADPTCSSSFDNIAASYAQLDNFQEAMKYFTKSLELDPSNSHAYINRGSMHIKNGNLEVAYSDYKRAVELDPNNASARQNLGMVKLMLNRNSEDNGLKDITEAVRLKTKSVKFKKDEDGEKNILDIDFGRKGVINTEKPRTSVIMDRIRCATCGKNEGKMKKCSRCMNVLYCSRDCQMKDWKNHKKICSKDQARILV